MSKFFSMCSGRNVDIHFHCLCENTLFVPTNFSISFIFFFLQYINHQLRVKKERKSEEKKLFLWKLKTHWKVIPTSKSHLCTTQHVERASSFTHCKSWWMCKNLHEMWRIFHYNEGILSFLKSMKIFLEVNVVEIEDFGALIDNCVTVELRDLIFALWGRKVYRYWHTPDFFNGAKVLHKA